MAAIASVFCALTLAGTAAAARGQQWHTLTSRHDDIPQPGPVNSLPGLPDGPPSYHESGYISVRGGAVHLFYYLATSESSAPEDDPVVLWLNGGPGCSSFDGFIYEHGPFNYRLEGGGRRVRLEPNPHSWTKAATMIYLDSPAGVGLSVTDDPADLATNDTVTAADSEEFLRRFFHAHPRLQGRDFYISGESYAGIYVPMLVKAVVDGNAAGRAPRIPIQGYLVGNGCTDQQYDGNAFPSFVVGKSLVPARLYAESQAACRGNFWDARSGSQCEHILDDMWYMVKDLNLYDVLEDTDPSRQLAEAAGATRQQAALTSAYRSAMASWQRWPVRGGIAEGEKVHNWAHLLQQAGVANDEGGNPPCTDASEADVWLNDPEVRAALHAVPPSRQRWVLCTGRIDYTHDAGSMLWIHQRLTQEEGLRALIYSGDHDMCVPHTGSEAWTRDMALAVEESWRPWFVNLHDTQGSQVAGYVVAYRNLTYATIRGAGHMVPENKPIEALTFFRRFLAGESL